MSTQIVWAPASGPSITFGTEALDYFLAGLDGIGPVASSPMISKGPGQPGASALDVIVPPRVVSAQAILAGADLAGLWALRAALSVAMTQEPVAATGALNLGLLTIKRGSGMADLEIQAMPNSISLPMPASAGAGYLATDCEWLCPYPFWRATADTLVTLASPYRDAVLATHPVGYWRLGEASGTVAVDQVGANNGTYVNAPTLGVAGLLTGDPDTAVTFAGASSQYVALGSGAGLAVDKDISVFAWFKSAVTPAALGTVVSRRDAGHTGYQLFVDSTGKVNGFIGGGADWVGTSVISAASVCDGVRHLIGMTRAAGGNLLGWVDGVNVGSATATTFVLSMTGASSANIGYYPEAGTWLLDGTIDEPAIWNRALSAAEVAALYAAGLAGGVTVVNNPGDALCPPLIRIYGDLTLVTVTNGTTGESFQIGGQIPAGQYVEIDTTPGGKSVELVNGSVRTSWMNQLNIATDALFSLAVGANSVSWTAGATGGSGARDVVLTYRPRTRGI